MKILIFGGTTEGRELAKAVAERHGTGHSVTVSVATSVGGFELTGVPEIQVLVGRRDAEEMAGLCRSYDLVVDATHPYAVEASANIRKAAQTTGVRLVRLVRDGDAGCGGAENSCAHYVSSAASAAAFLAGTEGRVLLTTGSKELAAFAQIPADRLYVRVLPTSASVMACERAGIPYRNIIAMMGPFTREMNAATLRQYQIAWMVTKESGTAGGFMEKIGACRDTGVRAVVIARPKESGLHFAEVLAMIDRECKSV